MLNIYIFFFVSKLLPESSQTCKVLSLLVSLYNAHVYGNSNVKSSKYKEVKSSTLWTTPLFCAVHYTRCLEMSELLTQPTVQRFVFTVIFFCLVVCLYALSTNDSLIFPQVLPFNAMFVNSPPKKK